MSSWRNEEFLRGNKGAIRIPFLSFQFLRRPGCTAKLLCFHTAGGFESDALPRAFLLVFNLIEKCLRGAKPRLAAWQSLACMSTIVMGWSAWEKRPYSEKRCAR